MAEALRLADALMETHPYPLDIKNAAAELRRLHAENERLLWSRRMIRDDIIRMAREAQSVYATETWTFSLSANQLEHFAALVAAAEREACAQIADAEASIEGIAQRIAAAIRARGNT